MGSNSSKILSNHLHLNHLKIDKIKAHLPPLKTTQPNPLGDANEQIDDAANSSLVVKISPESIDSRTSSIDLSFPSTSTPSGQGEINMIRDSVKELQSHTKTPPRRTSTPKASRKPKKVVLIAKSPDQADKDKRTGFECHFWVPITDLSIFTDKNDRRLKSIARSSGCSIELTNVSKLDSFGIPKRKVVILSVTTYGMAKCRNLIESKFPNFVVKSATVTPEIFTQPKQLV